MALSDFQKRSAKIRRQRQEQAEQMKQQANKKGFLESFQEFMLGKGGGIQEALLQTPEQQAYQQQLLNTLGTQDPVGQSLSQLQNLQPNPLQQQTMDIYKKLGPALQQRAYTGITGQTEFPSQVAQSPSPYSAQAQPHSDLNFLLQEYGPQAAELLQQQYPNLPQDIARAGRGAFQYGQQGLQSARSGIGAAIDYLKSLRG